MRKFAYFESSQIRFFLKLSKLAFLEQVSHNELKNLVLFVIISY